MAKPIESVFNPLFQPPYIPLSGFDYAIISAFATPTAPDTVGQDVVVTTTTGRISAVPTRIISIGVAGSVTSLALVDTSDRPTENFAVTAGNTYTGADLEAAGIHPVFVDGLRYVPTGSGTVTWTIE